MSAQVKVIKGIALSPKGATLLAGESSRDSLIDLRRALLHSLKAVEKQLGIEHRCPNCAYVLSK